MQTHDAFYKTTMLTTCAEHSDLSDNLSALCLTYRIFLKKNPEIILATIYGQAYFNLRF